MLPMRIHDVFAEAQVLIGEMRQAAEAAGKEDEVALWRYVREHRLFLMRTGQDYRFEDYLQRLDPARGSYVSAPFTARADPTSRQAIALLLKTLEDTAEPARKRLVLVLVEMLNFLAASGQYDAFADYLENAPTGIPWAIAWFATRAEADTWLSSLQEPPSSAYILIGDDYYSVWYSREDDERKFSRDDAMRPVLEELVNGGVPAAVAAVNTREEAREWLKSHPAAPLAVVTIAGEHHLAAYHKRLNRYTFHSLVPAGT